jgi:hypothetical protein
MQKQSINSHPAEALFLLEECGVPSQDIPPPREDRKAISYPHISLANCFSPDANCKHIAPKCQMRQNIEDQQQFLFGIY